jgi:hypothetical protein
MADKPSGCWSVVDQPPITSHAWIVKLLSTRDQRLSDLGFTTPFHLHFSLAQITAKCLDLILNSAELIDSKPMTLLSLALNRPELQLGEVLIPWVVVVGMFGFLAAWLVVAIMERTGLSRYVWHLPLFFLALVVLLSSVIGVFFQP